MSAIYDDACSRETFVFRERFFRVEDDVLGTLFDAFVDLPVRSCMIRPECTAKEEKKPAQLSTYPFWTCANPVFLDPKMYCELKRKIFSRYLRKIVKTVCHKFVLSVRSLNFGKLLTEE